MKQNSGINSAGNEKTEKLTSEPKKDIVSDGTEQMQGNADKNESAAFDGEARIEAAGTFAANSVDMWYPYNELVYPTKKAFSFFGNFSGELDVWTGNFVTKYTDVPAEDSVMGLEIAHVFRESDEDFHCGNNVRLNLNETFLPHDNPASGEAHYYYTDAKGDRYGFREYFYYLDNSGNRQEVSGSSVTVNPDGTLTDGTHEVHRELRSSTGLKAITEIRDIAGAEWYEQRREELKQLEEQVKAYEDIINEYKLVYLSDGKIKEADGEDILSEYNSATQLILPATEALQFQSLLQQKNSLEAVVGSETYIYPEINDVKKQLVSLKSALYELNWKIKGYLTDDEIKSDTSAVTEITTCINKNNYISTYYINKFLDSAKGYDFISGNSDTATKGYTVREQLRQRNLILEQIKTAEDNLDLQAELIENQLSYIQGKKDQYYAQFYSYCKEYRNKKEELETMERHLPVRFLTDGSIVKGFNRAGDLAVIFDRYENTAAIERDRENRIVRISDGVKEIAFSYNTDGLLSSITDANGKRTSYSYTSDGSSNKLDKLLVITNNNGKMSILFYNGYLLNSFNFGNYYSNIISTNSKTTQIKCNIMGNEIVHGNIINNTATVVNRFSADVEYSSNTTTITDTDRGEKVSYSFDGNGRLTKLIRELDGKIVQEERYTISPRNTVKTEYAKKSCLYKPTAEYQYVAGDSVTDTLNGFNKKTKTVKSAVKVDTTGATLQETVNYTYDSLQQLVTEKTTVTSKINDITSTRNFMKNYCYNAQGSLVRVEKYEEGKEYTDGKTVEETEYDERGNAVRSFVYNSLDTGSKFYTESRYSERGQILADLDETGRYETKYEYAGGTNVVRTEILPNGSRRSYGHDPEHRVSAVTQSTEDGEENSTQIVYTGDFPTLLTSGNNEIEYSYDPKGRVKSVKINSDTPYVTHTYTDSTVDGKKQTKTESVYINGNTAEKTEDVNGNITEIKYNGAVQAQIEYTEDGKCSKITDKVTKCSATKTYDELGRFGGYQYRKNTGASSGLSEVTERMVYMPDGKSEHRIMNIDSQETINGISFNDPLKKDIKAINYDNNFNIAVKRDLLGRNVGKEIKITGTQTDRVCYRYRKVDAHATNQISTVTYGDGKRLRYVYDECGNIIRIYENEALSVRYTYDKLNRLIREDNKALDKTCLISYDNNGNILTKESYAYSLGKRETLQTSTPVLWRYEGDRLITNGNGTNVYDVMGNPTTYQGKSITWSKGRQMTAYNGVTFAYDGLGRRYQKGNLCFTYGSESDLVYQSNGMEFVYDHEGVSGLKYGGNLYAYRKNAQGDIITILDNTGNVVVNYTYNAWGEHKVLNPDGTENTAADFIGNLNPFRYRSYYYDTETGLYYLKTRYYDPETGRFLNADDISYLDPHTINGLNLYAYCGNNPVMHVDPNGTNFWKNLFGVFLVITLVSIIVASAIITGGSSLIAIGVGFGVGASVNLISQGIGNILSGKSFFDDINIGSILISGLAGAAFATGIGGTIGAFAIGAASSMADSAFGNESWSNIFTNGMIGGVAASVGVGIQKTVSNIVFKNSDLLFMDFFEMAKVDGANIFRAIITGFNSSWNKFIPSLTPGIVRGFIKYIGNKWGTNN